MKPLIISVQATDVNECMRPVVENLQGISVQSVTEIGVDFSPNVLQLRALAGDVCSRGRGVPRAVGGRPRGGLRVREREEPRPARGGLRHLRRALRALPPGRRAGALRAGSDAGIPQSR